MPHSDNTKFKVLLITQGFGDVGGAGIYASELANSISKHGVEVHVMCLGSRTMTEHINQNLTIHWHKVISLPLLRVPSHHMQVWLRSRKIVREYAINTIHSNNYAGAFAYKKVPLLATIHHPATEEIKHTSTFQSLIYRFDVLFEKRVLKRASKVIVPSHFVKELFAKYKPPVQAIALANGIDISTFKKLHMPSLLKKYRNDEEILLFFPGGARAKRKGALDLFEALKDIQANFKCVVSGDMNVDVGWKHELEGALRDSGLASKFEFVGVVDFKELPKYYSAADIVVYPSTFEGFGFPALEALACEKPLICTKTGEMPYIVKDGQNGLLVDVGNVNQLRNALEELMSSEAVRKKLAKNARKSILHYSWDSLGEAVIELHRELMKELAR